RGLRGFDPALIPRARTFAALRCAGSPFSPGGEERQPRPSTASRSPSPRCGEERAGGRSVDGGGGGGLGIGGGDGDGDGGAGVGEIVRVAVGLDALFQQVADFLARQGLVLEQGLGQFLVVLGLFGQDA